jgi:hypothetical protein
VGVGACGCCASAFLLFAAATRYDSRRCGGVEQVRVSLKDGLAMLDLKPEKPITLRSCVDQE